MPSRPWTPQEEEHLARRFVEEERPYSLIATELGRPVEEVRRKGQKMGLWASVKWDLILSTVFDRARVVRCASCGTLNDGLAVRCGACKARLAVVHER